MERSFPEGFLWGASTSAHQVEGNNTNSDYWLMESLEGTMFQEQSGDAAGHYERYKEDIALMAGLGLNAYRFSIEWARIEPEEDLYNEAEIEHYRDMLMTCREYGITPIVTLHHFTSPVWLIGKGGWEAEETPKRFARYCEKVMAELGGLIPYVCTINEANIAIGISKMIKRRQSEHAQVGINAAMADRMERYNREAAAAFKVPPGELHTFLGARTANGIGIIFRAHTEARAVIRRVSPHTQVGITLSLYDIQSIPGGEDNARAALQEEFLQFLPYLQDDDFFGLQNYTRYVYGPDGTLPVHEGAERTQMGNEFYPEGLEAVVRLVSKELNKPIMVTENGVATEDDGRRIAFIRRALEGVNSCIRDGLPVIGYMHWSLMDNFEWQLGYSKTFGLIAVDRHTQQRIPKPSAYFYGEIAAANKLTQRRI